MDCENSSLHTVGFVGASLLPSFSAFAGFASSSGFVADCLNDCSKSPMISSMCSVPTDILMRSYNNISMLHARLISSIRTSVTPLLIFSSSLSCSCVVLVKRLAHVLKRKLLSEYDLLPRMDGKRFRVTNVCKVGDELEIVNDLATSSATSLYAE